MRQRMMLVEHLARAQQHMTQVTFLIAEHEHFDCECTCSSQTMLGSARQSKVQLSSWASVVSTGRIAFIEHLPLVGSADGAYDPIARVFLIATSLRHRLSRGLLFWAVARMVSC